MTITQTLVLCVVIFPLILALLKWIRIDFAAILIATTLGFLQLLGYEVFGVPNGSDKALLSFSGFSRPSVIVLVCLFTLTGALERSGFARWLTKHILAIGGSSLNRLIFLFSTTAAILSLVINDVAVGALLIPSVLETYKLTDIKPSKLLIPVAFGSLLGGMATYFTTANILVNDLYLALSPESAPLTFSSFFPLGGLITLMGLVFIAAFGNLLLPSRDSRIAADVKRSTGSELEEYYELYERIWQVTIRRESLLAGRTIEEIGFGKNYGLTVVAVHKNRNGFELPSAELVFKPGDRLIIIGREERISMLSDFNVLVKPIGKEKTLSKQGLKVIEFLVAPRSRVVGKTLKELNFRKNFSLSVIALQRGKRIIRTDVGSHKLDFGDSLLVVGESSRFDALRFGMDFLILEPSSSDQPLNIKNTIISLGALVGSVIASILGIPVYFSLMVAVIMLLVFNVITLQDMYRMIEWRIVFFVGCMYSVSYAMIETGLAELLSQSVLPLTEKMGVAGLAGLAFLMSSAIAQFMGGQVAVLITGPIALSAAMNNGFNLTAIAVATAIGCSNCFLTPMAHGVNLIMMTPGGYDFKDYFRIGKWLFIISFVGLYIGIKIIY